MRTSGVIGATLALVGSFALWAQARPEAAPPPAASGHTAHAYDFDGQIRPLLGRYCTKCHGEEELRADVRLTFRTEEEARNQLDEDDQFWERVTDMLVTQQMPPERGIQPSDSERDLLVDWVNARMATVTGEPDPGPFMIRRLNNREYANTVRDLLYLPAQYNPATDFPADERGDGFDNNSGTLTISPLLIESYLAAAERSANTALNLLPAPAGTKAGDQTLATKTKLNEPSAGFREDFADRQAKIRLNLQLLAPRAFRRPVTKVEIDELMKFAALSFAHAGESFDEATALAARATMMSPEFLFHIERDPNPDGTGKVFEITEYQLASRLSYFLWSTMPDEALFKAAKAGTLRQNLEVEVRRMLDDPKAISLTRDFLGQWLEIRGLHDTPNADPALLAAMQGETEHFFDYIVRNNRSIMEFLDADYTFVNERLAKLYGIPGIKGDEFQKVTVDHSRRGGIFTQASFLTLTSKPLGDTRRTSPVLRGKWILENIFNQTIPPPPPDVPQIEFDPNKRLTGTVRQIFEQHRVDPSCAVCHVRMDPYGFALENYDGYGAWRDQDNQIDIDASGEIGGKKFGGPAEMRRLLATRQDEFRVALVRKLLSYALGRGIQHADRPAIASIAAAVKADGDRFSSLMLNIIRSYPFQHARGMKGEPPPPAMADAATVFHPVLVPLPPQPPPVRRRPPGLAPPGAPAAAQPAAAPAAGSSGAQAPPG